MTEMHYAMPIGFKEWAHVCDALTEGVQTLILRKGGIHEGKGGFEFKHSTFFLFPTWFHTQGEMLRWLPETAQVAFPPEEGRQSVEISGFAKLEALWRVTDWDRVQALHDLHIWKDEVIEERFQYDGETCLHIALVRAFRLPSIWQFPYQKSYGGCRSWITLPEEGNGLIAAAAPAMNDETWQVIAAKVTSILGEP
jgi:hypothetical protein